MTATLTGDLYKITRYNKNLNEIAYGKLQLFLVASMTHNTLQEITCFMDQRSIVFFPSMKGLSAKAIYQNQIEKLGAEVITISTVT
jgi:hypothetical protein